MLSVKDPSSCGNISSIKASSRIGDISGGSLRRRIGCILYIYRHCRAFFTALHSLNVSSELERDTEVIDVVVKCQTSIFAT